MQTKTQEKSPKASSRSLRLLAETTNFHDRHAPKDQRVLYRWQKDQLKHSLIRR